MQKMAESRPLLEVPLSGILSDDTWRISRPGPSSQLVSSVRNSGILRPPVLAVSGKKYIPLTGHNRILAASEAGLASVPAYVYDEPDPECILKEALLKACCRELGPAGRIKAFVLTENYTAGRYREGLGIPEWAGPDFFSGFEKLPAVMKKYFDARDIPFKVIQQFMELPGRTPEQIAAWMGFPVRANIFRRIVSMAAEAVRRDGAVSLPEPDMKKLPAEQEEILFRTVFDIRYPEYSVMKKQADELISALTGSGVSVEFPEYFEGGQLALKFSLNRRDGFEGFRRKSEAVDRESLEKLLKLL